MRTGQIPINGEWLKTVAGEAAMDHKRLMLMIACDGVELSLFPHPSLTADDVREMLEDALRSLDTEPQAILARREN